MAHTAPTPWDAAALTSAFGAAQSGLLGSAASYGCAAVPPIAYGMAPLGGHWAVSSAFAPVAPSTGLPAAPLPPPPPPPPPPVAAAATGAYAHRAAHESDNHGAASAQSFRKSFAGRAEGSVALTESATAPPTRRSASAFRPWAVVRAEAAAAAAAGVVRVRPAAPSPPRVPTPPPPPPPVPFQQRSPEREPPREFRCGQCGKAFSRRERLVAHARVHSGEKPFLCGFPSCGMRFADSSNRRRHERTHIDGVSLACSRCGRKFLRRDECRRHELFSCFAPVPKQPPLRPQASQPQPPPSGSQPAPAPPAASEPAAPPPLSPPPPPPPPPPQPS